MSNSVYQINKGINQSIEFKGLKAQYIWYLGAGVVALLIVFAIMYIIGLPPLICVVIIGFLGTVLVVKIYGMSNKYGEHGLMKTLAQRSIPKAIRIRSRAKFITLKNQERK
ncbi:DUF4133 domain-containing protein [Pedobacter chitinilyticus]|uniref:DUF4133 domain-containing protein n=1 Tax=Pedobacter chitinilyticus TaxID=2233776 RepID=A0A443YW30_9SPHI|nr:DUF4133 domain-containing protein [Pedobacter chitinilyticus]RWU08138.1 DUF4133 domain-containing protein [Pedobacter chitinilyticus]